MTDPRPEFWEFRTLVEQAEAEAEVAVVGNLIEATKRDHRAALAWLERRAPERWRLDDRHGGGPTAPASDDEVVPAAEPKPRGTERTLMIPAAYMSDFERYVMAAQSGAPLPVWPDEERLKRFRESSDDE